MKIKKISQSAGIVANVVNSLNSDSSVDALSAAAGKQLRKDYSVIVSYDEPSSGEKIWIQQGKNFLSSNYEISSSTGGITMTIEDDGSVTLDGTATQNMNVTVPFKLPQSLLGKEITLSSIISPATESRYYPGLKETTTSGGSVDHMVLYAAEGGAVTKVVTQEMIDGINTFHIFITSGYVLNNLNFKNMVEQGPKQTQYEKYIQSKIYIKNDNGIYEEYRPKTEFLNGEIIPYTDTITLKGGLMKHYNLTRINGITYINALVNYGENIPNSAVIVAKVPYRFRPDKSTSFTVGLGTSENNGWTVDATGYGCIYADSGDVYIRNASGLDCKYAHINIAYPSVKE